MPTLFMAELNTIHFSFHAFGKTKKETEQQLWDGWVKHCGQTGITLEHSSFPTKASMKGEFNIIEVKLPMCIRDMNDVL